MGLRFEFSFPRGALWEGALWVLSILAFWGAFSSFPRIWGIR